jgi:hypothetical protein
MLLNNTPWHAPITENPALNSVEIWSLANLTGDAHPIHLHLVRFQILDRRRFDTFAYQNQNTLRYTGAAMAPEPHEAGWKDTARADPAITMVENNANCTTNGQSQTESHPGAIRLPPSHTLSPSSLVTLGSTFRRKLSRLGGRHAAQSDLVTSRSELYWTTAKPADRDGGGPQVDCCQNHAIGLGLKARSLASDRNAPHPRPNCPYQRPGL